MKLSYAHALIRAISLSSDVSRLAVNESKARACDQVFSVDPALHAEESQGVVDMIDVLIRFRLGVTDKLIHVEPNV